MTTTYDNASAIAGSVDSRGYLYCVDCRPEPTEGIVLVDSLPHCDETCDGCDRQLTAVIEERAAWNDLCRTHYGYAS
jgi:cell wall assembly regulator SMI1